MLSLSILIENTASSPEYDCEHGLSFLLESEDTAILFDTGQSGAFLDNAARMGCDLFRVTEVVLSHGHYDHTGGLGHALRHIAGQKNEAELPRVICHPDVLLQRRRTINRMPGSKSIGMPEDSRKALEAWPVHFSTTPLWVRDDIVFLGEIPRTHPDLCALVGEIREADGYTQDRLPDDSALAYVTPRGLVIIAGCSHAGIVNIVEHAKDVTGVRAIYALFGGLHFKDMPSDAVRRSMDFLDGEGITKLYACHCTGNALASHPAQLRLAAGSKYTLSLR